MATPPPATIMADGAKIIINSPTMMSCVLFSLNALQSEVTPANAQAGIAVGRQQLLDTLTAVAGSPCQGLAKAARMNRDVIDKDTKKKLEKLDGANAELRHFTQGGMDMLITNVSKLVSVAHAKSAAKPTGSPPACACGNDLAALGGHDEHMSQKQSDPINVSKKDLEELQKQHIGTETQLRASVEAITELISQLEDAQGHVRTAFREERVRMLNRDSWLS